MVNAIEWYPAAQVDRTLPENTNFLCQPQFNSPLQNGPHPNTTPTPTPTPTHIRIFPVYIKLKIKEKEANDHTTPPKSSPHRGNFSMKLGQNCLFSSNSNSSTSHNPLLLYVFFYSVRLKFTTMHCSFPSTSYHWS